MNLESARQIVGRANACEPYLSNMIRALRLLPALNTDEDNERLQAALIVRREKRKRGKSRA